MKQLTFLPSNAFNMLNINYNMYVCISFSFAHRGVGMLCVRHEVEARERPHTLLRPAPPKGGEGGRSLSTTTPLTGDGSAPETYETPKPAPPIHVCPEGGRGE